MENVEELREAVDLYEHCWYFPSSSNTVSYILGVASVRLADITNNDASMKLAEISWNNGWTMKGS